MEQYHNNPKIALDEKGLIYKYFLIKNIYYKNRNFS